MSPTLFESILRKLKERDFRTLLISDVIEWLEGKRVFPERSVVLTFDDGYESLYFRAFPLLEELRFKATVFLTTEYCGKSNNWPTQTSDIPSLSLLKWQQIKEMVQSVFDVQAHTRTHPVLTQLSPECVINELVGSKLDIEDRLGKRVRFFAYPYGRYNNGIYGLVREYFDAACCTSLSFAYLRSDRYLLERVDMYYFSGLLSSNIFWSPLQKPYLYLRKLIRKVHNKEI